MLVKTFRHSVYLTLGITIAGIYNLAYSMEHTTGEYPPLYPLHLTHQALTHILNDEYPGRSNSIQFRTSAHPSMLSMRESLNAAPPGKALVAVSHEEPHTILLSPFFDRFVTEMQGGRNEYMKHEQFVRFVTLSMIEQSLRYQQWHTQNPYKNIGTDPSTIHSIDEQGIRSALTHFSKHDLEQLKKDFENLNLTSHKGYSPFYYAMLAYKNEMNKVGIKCSLREGQNELRRWQQTAEKH
jgi:hypothetical protein